MAQDIIVRIIDRNGDKSIERKETITVADETAECVHPSHSLAADTKTTIDLGAVVTANTIVVELLTGSPTQIKFYKDATDFILFKDYLAVIGAAGIAALATYVISGPPNVWSGVVSREQLHALTEARIWIAMALLGAFVPGIVWIVAAIVTRVNRIHIALAEIDLP